MLHCTPVSRVSVIIPAFNEELAIGAVLTALRALPIESEIIVIDDGSLDQTGAIAREHGAIVLRHPVTAGYGKSVKDGIFAATTDIIILSDADGTYPIDMIPSLIARFAEGFDMVVGARSGLAYRGSFLKMPARYVFKFLAEFSTGTVIPDINSGLRIFRRSDVLPHLPDLCNGFSFTTTITLLYLFTGRIIGYMPIAYHRRIGRSKVRMVRDSLRTLQYLVEAIVRFNPVKLFFLLACMTLFIGSLGAVWVGTVAVVGAVLCAFLIFALGLVAETCRRRV